MASHLTLFRKTKIAGAAALAGLMLTGCASDLGGGAYGRSAVGIPQESLEGSVIDVRPVVIEGTRSGIGAGTGAIVGGSLGSTVGGGTAERIAVGALGAIVGGVLGAAAEEGGTRRQGHEYTVQLDNGNTVTIVQQDTQPIAGPGSRVRVLYGDRVRVVPLYRY